MFKIENGKIVITSAAAHISQEYTPEEWEAHILYLLDMRDEAQRELAGVKLVEIPERPTNMDITAFVQWKSEADEVAKQRTALEKRMQELRLKSSDAERKIVAMMPENVTLFIEDDENDCTSTIWWTSKYDSGNNWYPDVRIRSFPNPATESDNAFGYDDEAEIGGVPSEYSGENNEPPAPVNPDDIPF